MNRGSARVASDRLFARMNLDELYANNGDGEFLGSLLNLKDWTTFETEIEIEKSFSFVNWYLVVLELRNTLFEDKVNKHY